VNDLTTVELLWLEKRIENWIRFGRAVAEQITDRRRRVLSFAPGSMFAFVRWASNDYGTIISRIDILRAATNGQRSVMSDNTLNRAVGIMGPWRRRLRARPPLDRVDLAQ
jgi:hypothetical protein